MRLIITVEENLDKNDDFFGLYKKKEYVGKETSMDTRTEEWEGVEVTTYTQYAVTYNDDLPTWIDNIDQCVKALEKHYGYGFDMKKYIKHLKNKEEKENVLKKKNKIAEFFSEDPDH